MSLIALLWVGASARAEDEAPADPTLDELEARLAALEAALLLAQSPPPPPPPSAPSWNALNPGITAFGDVVTQVGVADGGVSPGSTVYLRSLELQLRAAVDPFAKADAVIAFEQEAPPIEGGPAEGFGAEPEEVYVDLVALPARLSARIGKFKAPFGVVNRIHPHDLPWTDAPAVLDLVGDEGYTDTGASLSWILPLGPVALTVTGGAFGGEPFDPEGLRAAPTGLGRAELFLGGGGVDASLGASVLQDTETEVRGADLTFRWRPNQRRSVVLLAEAVQGDGGEIGGYAALQVQPSRSVYVGVREDFPEGRHSAFLTYYTSEFLRVRAGAGFVPATGNLTALAQLTFVWGSHPVEPWWVNR